MKISIIFKKGFDESVITFDTRQLAKNYINILKSEQTKNSGLDLVDLYYPEDLNGYIESVLDKECIDSGFYYDYNEDVEKLIDEITIDVDDLLIKGII
jgi:hypothetical protein